MIHDTSRGESFMISTLPSKTILLKTCSLRREGFLQIRDNYCYLKIDDDYIHLTYPDLSSDERIQKPDYFKSSDDIGAHISVIYLEERVRVKQNHHGQRHLFTIQGLIKARLGLKDYFALSVISSSLDTFRQQHALGPKPTFKGQTIVFHITVGIRNHN